jgi:hypothetical protein
MWGLYHLPLQIAPRLHDKSFSFCTTDINVVCLRGSVRTARCLSLLSAERLPLEDARVCGFEETECECDFRTAEPTDWVSLCLSWFVEETADMAEVGRGEVVEDAEVPGGGRAEGSR